MKRVLMTTSLVLAMVLFGALNALAQPDVGVVKTTIAKNDQQVTVATDTSPACETAAAVCHDYIAENARAVSAQYDVGVPRVDNAINFAGSDNTAAFQQSSLYIANQSGQSWTITVNYDSASQRGSAPNRVQNFGSGLDGKMTCNCGPPRFNGSPHTARAINSGPSNLTDL
jgi:hypothetical protein